MERILIIDSFTALNVGPSASAILDDILLCASCVSPQKFLSHPTEGLKGCMRYDNFSTKKRNLHSKREGVKTESNAFFFYRVLSQ